MKCSGGVAVIAVVVLLGSALTIVMAAGGMAVAMRMSASALEPSALPPGTDVGMMRNLFVGVLAAFGTIGLVGAASGVGLIRLWRWSRYATIVLAGLVIFTSLSGAAGMLLITPPPASAASGATEMPMWFRAAAAAFYSAFGVVAAGFIVFLTRARIAAQFTGEVTAPIVRVRPLSVTIIAWLMIVSAVMTIPAVFLISLPGVLLGLILTGIWAKVYYAAFFTAQIVIGIGLLRQTADSLMPAIVLHALAIPNGLIMLIPGMHRRYETAVANAMPFGADQTPPGWAQPVGLMFAFVYTGIILYFLISARRKLAAATDAAF